MQYDRDFGTICGCAVRYSLGRQTYISSLVQDYIKRNIEYIDSRSLAVMARDIKEAPSYGNKTIDKPGWMNFLAVLEKELKDRGYGNCVSTST